MPSEINPKQSKWLHFWNALFMIHWYRAMPTSWFFFRKKTNTSVIAIVTGVFLTDYQARLQYQKDRPGGKTHLTCFVMLNLGVATKKACIFSSALSILGDETFWSTRSLYEVKLIFPSAACSSVWSFRWPLDFRISHEIKMVCCCKPVSHYTHTEPRGLKGYFIPLQFHNRLLRNTRDLEVYTQVFKDTRRITKMKTVIALVHYCWLISQTETDKHKKRNYSEMLQCRPAFLIIATQKYGFSWLNYYW